MYNRQLNLKAILSYNVFVSRKRGTRYQDNIYFPRSAGRYNRKVVMTDVENFESHVCPILKELRRNSQLCDGIVYTEDGSKFDVHRAIVSAASPLFKTIFTSDLCGGDAHEVTIPNISPDIMLVLLDYAYSGQVELTVTNLEKVLAAANQLLITEVAKKCALFMENHLTFYNCLMFYNLSFSHDLPTLQKAARSFILSNFREITQISEVFTLLTCEDLRCFIRSDNLNVRQEVEVFDAVMRWVDYDPDSRKCHLLSLLELIRFGLFDYDLFTSTVLEHSFITESIECQEMLFSTSLRLQQINRDRRHNFSLLCRRNYQTRPRIPHSIIFALGGWSSGSATNLMETYDVRYGHWFEIPHGDVLARAYHGIAVVDGLIYLVGGFDGTHFFSTVRCFDPVQLRWSERSCMNYARCYVSVTVLGGLIYALGGYNGRIRTSSCEKYDPRENQWTLLPDMNEQRSDASAAAFRGRIYIAGGFNGNEVLMTAEVFDPLSERWTLIEPMLSAKSGISLVSYNDSLYVIGGFNGIERLASVERYDDLRDLWIETAPMITSRSNFATAQLEGKLFVIGGFNGSTTISIVEVFDSRDGTWKIGPNLGANRSALSCCVIDGLPNASHYSCLGHPPQLKLNHVTGWQSSS